MSKPDSGHFIGTTGKNHSKKTYYSDTNLDDIINKRYFELDFREHPTKYKQLSSKKSKELRQKLATRTISKKEYKLLMWQKRLNKRRSTGIDNFWAEERDRILNNQPTTRNWNAQQRMDILSGKRPKYKNTTMQSHHTYSVSKYPHLANIGRLIYPATKYEHIAGWHGGNTRNSLPGMPIKNIKEF